MWILKGGGEMLVYTGSAEWVACARVDRERVEAAHGNEATEDRFGIPFEHYYSGAVAGRQIPAPMHVVLSDFVGRALARLETSHASERRGLMGRLPTPAGSAPYRGVVYDLADHIHLEECFVYTDASCTAVPPVAVQGGRREMAVGLAFAAVTRDLDLIRVGYIGLIGEASSADVETTKEALAAALGQHMCADIPADRTVLLTDCRQTALSAGENDIERLLVRGHSDSLPNNLVDSLARLARQSVLAFFEPSTGRGRNVLLTPAHSLMNFWSIEQGRWLKQIVCLSHRLKQKHTFSSEGEFVGSFRQAGRLDPVELHLHLVEDCDDLDAIQWTLLEVGQGGIECGGTVRLRHGYHFMASLEAVALNHALSKVLSACGYAGVSPDSLSCRIHLPRKHYEFVVSTDIQPGELSDLRHCYRMQLDRLLERMGCVEVVLT